MKRKVLGIKETRDREIGEKEYGRRPDGYARWFYFYFRQGTKRRNARRGKNAKGKKTRYLK